MTDDLLDIPPQPPIDSYELSPGVYPEGDRFHLMKIKRRALHLLEGLTGDEIKEYEDDRITLILMSRRNYEKELIEEIKAAGEVMSSVKNTDILRYAMRNKLTIYGKKEIKNRWPEFFALLALSRFNFAVSIVESILEENDKELWDPIHLKHHADFQFMDALEAVIEAESLFEKREKKRKANKASRREQDAVKKKLIIFYTNHKNIFKSITQTVRDFKQTISEEEIKRFASGNIDRTLCSYLSKYKKSISTKQ